MAPSSSSSRGRRQADGNALEEGEFDPGYCSSASDDYSLSKSCREEETRPPQLCRRLEEILARAPAAMLPSYQGELDRTIVGDDDYSHPPASFVSAVVGAPTYSCRVCGKGFGSSNAVDGHMSVHNPPERNHGKEYLVVSPGWAFTGKRGWTGSKGKAVVSSSEEVNHSMATTVLSEPNRPSQPMALPLLSRSNLSSSMASARTNLESGETSSPPSTHNEPGVSAVGANNPCKEAFVHQQLPQVALQLEPAVPAPAQGPAAPQREYTCKICGKSFPTPQGLGGHAAGHKNKQREAEAAAGFGQDGNAIPEAARNDMQDHKCQKCDKVFATGVALGGHMRLHYKGPPIVHRKSKKRCVAPPPPPPAAPLTSPTVCMADLTVTLGNGTGQPSHSSPLAASRLRLFGIDICLPVAEAPAVQEGTGIRPQVEAPEVQEGTDTTPHGEAPHQEVEGSALTTEGSASTGGQRQDENVEKQI